MTLSVFFRFPLYIYSLLTKSAINLYFPFPLPVTSQIIPALFIFVIKFPAAVADTSNILAISVLPKTLFTPTIRKNNFSFFLVFIFTRISFILPITTSIAIFSSSIATFSLQSQLFPPQSQPSHQQSPHVWVSPPSQLFYPRP